jgi:hypothetical protein
MRGLADSGQANIADIQSQRAYGQTISDLYGQKQNVEQQAVTQSMVIEENVRQATTQANITRGRQQLESDTQLFQQVQAIEDNRKAQVASLVELSMSGQYSPQQIQQLADAYGVTNDDLTTVMNASAYFDPKGELRPRERWDWESIGTAALGGGAAGAAVGTILPGVGTVIGAVVGAIGAGAAAIGGEIGNNWIGTMSISPGQGYEPITGRPPEVIAQVNQMYSDFEGSDQIKADLDWSFLGQGDRIVFRYDGKAYNTYNEALAALRARG